MLRRQWCTLVLGHRVGRLRAKYRARCFAEISSAPGAYSDQSNQVGIDVTIDPNDGSYIWETTE